MSFANEFSYFFDESRQDEAHYKTLSYCSSQSGH